MTCALNACNLHAFSVCAFNQVTGKLLGPVEARVVGVVPGLGQAQVDQQQSILIPPSPALVRTLCEWMVPQTPARPNGGTSPFEITDTIWGGCSTTYRRWS